jgi:glutamyl-tRNA(Gln) amidotransferase subunit E
VAGALAKDGGAVLGVPLPGFEGVMRSADGKLRLGAEMAQRAKMRAGVMGIFHSDELPGYGISEEDVQAMTGQMGIGNGTAFAICADEARKARPALEAAVERANLALEGVPEETRDPQPDGSSAYSRPLPGASRMYPETDVKPIIVTEERMQAIKLHLPQLPEQTERKFVMRYGIHEQQARQIVREGYEDLFEEVASTYGMAAVAARTLLNTLPEIQKEGADISRLDDAALMSAFRALHEGAFAKEALPAVLKSMAGGRSVEDATKELGLVRMGSSEAEAVVAAIVREREAFVREKGMAAVGPLMGPVMERLRGKVDGKMASELLKKEISKMLQG